MDAVVETAAPAQPEAAPVLTPIESAVVADDQAAFNEAWRDKRANPSKPVAVPDPPPEAPTAATPAAEEPRPVSKRQQKINDYERQIAELNQRIARLEPPPDSIPAAPAQTEATFPTYADYLTKHPDASLEDYIDARQDHRDAVKAQQTAAQRAQWEQQSARETQIAEARDRTTAARQADPALDAAFKQWEADPTTAPKILFVPTREQLIEQARAKNVAPIFHPANDLASAIVASEFSPQLLHYLSQHPEVVEEASKLPTPRAVHMFVGKLETRFETADPAAPVAAPPKTLTSAPAPGTTLGSRSASPADPLAAAIKADDQAAFNAAWLAKKSAGRRA